jgi:hypothetical protein
MGFSWFWGVGTRIWSASSASGKKQCACHGDVAGGAHGKKSTWREGARAPGTDPAERRSPSAARDAHHDAEAEKFFVIPASRLSRGTPIAAPSVPDRERSPAGHRDAGLGGPVPPFGEPLMDVIDLMRADHRALDRQLDELAAEAAIHRRGERLRRAAARLRHSVHGEEAVFYPAFRDACGTGGDRGLFLEALEAHCLAGELLLDRLEALPPGDARFPATARELRDVLRRHHAREHQVIFPRARQLMSAALLRSLARCLNRLRRPASEPVPRAA